MGVPDLEGGLDGLDKRSVDSSLVRLGRVEPCGADAVADAGDDCAVIELDDGVGGHGGRVGRRERAPED
jgi:selenophosphate synthetase-related protein